MSGQLFSIVNFKLYKLNLLRIHTNQVNLLSFFTAICSPPPIGNATLPQKITMERPKGVFTPDKPGALSLDQVLEQVAKDDQEEWEYEYSTTETEVCTRDHPVE